MNNNLILLLALGTAGMLLLFCSVILLQIRSQNRMLKMREQAQEAALQHQKDLLTAAVLTQENERRRIGQDLHDDIGAALSGLRLSLELYTPPDNANEIYLAFKGRCREQIDSIIKEVRHISHHLSPALLSLYGLEAALNKQLQYINDSSGLSAVLNNEATDVVNQLSLETATAIYRVLEELLNNTIKHAAATKIAINLSAQQSQLIIGYEDNGKGLPANTDVFINGIGMRNIESRLSLIGAQYQLGALGKKGFQINMQYSLPQSQAAHA